MTVWRTEVQFDAAVVVGTADGTPSFPVQASRALIVQDQAVTYAIREFLTATFDGTNFHYQTQADGALFVSFNPLTGEMDQFTAWTIWNDVPPGPIGMPITVPGKGSYLIGGTLGIEKEVSADRLTFYTPLGNISTSLSAIAAQYPGPNYANETALTPYGLGHELFVGGNGGPAACHEITKWYNLLVKRDAATLFFSAMSAAQPMLFDVTNGGTFGFTENNAQEATRYSIESENDPSETFRGEGSLYLDPFLPDQHPASGQIDCCPGLPHRWLFCVFCDMVGALMLRISDSLGHVYQTRPIAQPPACFSPSVQWLEGTLVVVYDDGTDIRQTTSYDVGLSWSIPMPVAITGTNPRLVIGPDSTRYYFYISSGNIQLQRSVDQGASLFDPLPIQVNDSVAAPAIADFGAVCESDLSLVIAYFGLDSLWHTRISTNAGLNWRDA